MSGRVVEVTRIVSVNIFVLKLAASIAPAPSLPIRISAKLSLITFVDPYTPKASTNWVLLLPTTTKSKDISRGRPRPE